MKIVRRARWFQDTLLKCLKPSCWVSFLWWWKGRRSCHQGSLPPGSETCENNCKTITEIQFYRCSPSIQQKLCSLINSRLKAIRWNLFWCTFCNFRKGKIPTWINLSILSFDAGEMTGGMSVLASWPAPTYGKLFYKFQGYS